MMQLYDYQLDAINKLRNGNILVGGVGSGKSITAIAYYYKECGGSWGQNGYSHLMKSPVDLYIITTARKRDEHEWDRDLAPFYLRADSELDLYPGLKVTVDSWNNIKKYKDVTNCFFIFDEQRVIGYGSWSKSFIKISKSNKWILLTATPGDTWMDYISVFIANGFYRNKTDFINQHAIYSRFSKYPKIDRYVNTGKLVKQRDQILVEMKFNRKTLSHHIDIWCDFNLRTYKKVYSDRVNPYDDLIPITNASEMCFLLRRVCNSDDSRCEAVLEIFQEHPKAIVFYNFNYELDALREMASKNDIPFTEWNGQKHEAILKEHPKWLYFVQYIAGSEGWNCIETDTIIFFSQNYSYRTMIQAAGRIDRLTTPFRDLYYYHLKSRSPIDYAIMRALGKKKKFNEKEFIGTWK